MARETHSRRSTTKENIVELLEYNLTKHGYQVTCVTTGEQALTAAKADVPDYPAGPDAARSRRDGGLQDLEG